MLRRHAALKAARGINAGHATLRRTRHFWLIFLCFRRVSAQSDDVPLRSANDPGVVTTRQTIGPAGMQTIFTGRVYGAAFGVSTSELWVLNASEIYRLDWQANKVLSSVTLGGNRGRSIRYDARTRRV